MAVQEELVPGTHAWARLSKKDRAKELARLRLAADRDKKAKPAADRDRSDKRGGSR